jgi:SAM-dependent methyltransferase
MSAVQEWKRRISAYRQQRVETDQESWERLTPWYDDWVEHNDYVELVRPRLRPYVGPGARVLEIGPGSGGFTVPLARMAAQVVAVEPSPGMRDLLAANLAQAGLANVQVLPDCIEDSRAQLVGLAPFDLAFASFSLYNVKDIDSVVRELLGLACRLVILLGTGSASGWSRPLYRQFMGEEQHAPPQLRHLYPVLLEMDIYADVEIIWSSYNHVYPNEQAMVSWWMRRFRLEEARREEMRSALLELATREEGGRIGIYQRRPMAWVWIDRERHVVPGNGHWDSAGEFVRN